MQTYLFIPTKNHQSGNQESPVIQEIWLVAPVPCDPPQVGFHTFYQQLDVIEPSNPSYFDPTNGESGNRRYLYRATLDECERGQTLDLCDTRYTTE